jgi:hypothetical protein
VKGEAVLAVDTFQRWKITDEWVPLVSERKRTAAYPFGLSVARPGPSSELGRNVSPDMFSIFFISFSLFYFLISDLFQTFANLFQIDSNKFLNYSNNHRKVLNQ